MAKFGSVRPSKRQNNGVQVPYFTKRLLMEAAKKGGQWDYNRQLDPDKLASLPELNFPVTQAFIHEYRHFQKCEPHVRCVVLVPAPPSDGVRSRRGRTELTHCIVDVPTDFFKALPRFYWRKGAR